MAHKGTAGRYTIEILNNLWSLYKGQRATVLAVQLNESALRRVRPNALGEIVAEDNIVNPYFDIVVQFGDETLAACTAYPPILKDLAVIELLSAASSVSEQMAKQLPLIIGKTVYAVGYSKLYQPDTTLEELTGFGSKSLMQQLRPTDVPLLQPLTVLTAKYIESTGVVFKLKLPNGKEALSFTERSYYMGEDSDRPFIRRVIGTLVTEIPDTLTQKEIDAIKTGTIYKGMTKDALTYMLGFKDKENDWGSGGKQWIYYDGRLLIYLDKDNKIQDWQSFEKK
jgi:hypothetical protein